MQALAQILFTFSLSSALLHLLIHAEINYKPSNSFTAIDIIHRHSPLSPFRNAAFHSVSRYSKRHLHLQTNVIPAVDDPESDYIMKIYVGTPPLETWAILDPGSDLVWLQCLPCNTCYPQYPPLFNPRNSSTYKTTSCRAKTCSFRFFHYWDHGCGIEKQCVYSYGYDDDSITRGELARDFISLGGQSGHLTRRGLLFGCGHNNTGIFGKTEAGIVGLGNGPLSLISQLGPKIGYKFSYCLVPFSSNSTGKLKLGQDATISSSSNGVVTTPLKFLSDVQRYYFLNIEGITVGKKTTKIINELESGLTLIDSGTSGTFIPSNFYKRVEALVKEAVGVEALENPPHDFKLCFKNESVVNNKINNLKFVVQFQGAKLFWRPENIFVSHDYLLCFAIFPTQGQSIYGNLAQVNFEVEYDLKGKQVSFTPKDCSK